ncbi:hypothetical protein PPL_06751 [Heterostelium album PN500]|uniref:Glutathione S-transferase n=1 Tax=Heterostelium pallidum (strain ATCC 26659 / Pp 5 / PN500) TaxID=670386 RepID=D3BFL6_HETP5|nr:hypothetical protein PPL_06751 [Heterostelium album PN500]EFA79930.1 hypothetical protein PPL_06751 [Heterostelium album PN500]|eukprot:XP_020432050.1 hypothetical protein PPL_06751 [Heterostelium album PN500]
MITSQIPTLHYFNGRGRAETSRVLFVVAGVEFNDVKNPFDNAEIKQRATYKQLPYLIDGDFEISQSIAIENYIANKYNLAGDSLVDRTRILSIAQASYDISIPIFTNDTDEKKALYKNETLPRFLSAWEKILTENGGKHFVGSKLSAADVSAYTTLENLYSKNYKEVVDKYPTLTNFKSTFEAIPSISDYLSKRPKDLFF